jgi:hypothetical protein
VAASGTLTISCTIANTNSGTKGPLGGTSGLQVTVTANEAAAAAITQVTLVAGFQTIAVPAAATVGVVIVPPPSSAATKTLKGVAGDTGTPIGTATPDVITFPSGAAPATIGITAGGSADTLPTEFWWF